MVTYLSKHPNMSLAKRVAQRWKAAGIKAEWVRGNDRSELLPAIWDMYKTSYEKIGLHIPGASGLMKYDAWEVFFDEDNNPKAFNLYKTTPLGLKAGLLGSDGSSEAKSIIKTHVRDRFKRGNVYGEVSHAVERLTQGVPVVCAIYVPGVLRKPVIPEEDGVHYQRNLTGIGRVTKKLVGNPRGIKSMAEGSCPIPDQPGVEISPGDKTASEDDSLDAAEHLSCQLEWN